MHTKQKPKALGPNEVSAMDSFDTKWVRNVLIS